jgi:hypothetical protein
LGTNHGTKGASFSRPKGGAVMKPEELAKDKTFALKLYGDSMEPDFHEGEVVIIDPEVIPETGDFVVVELFGDVAEAGQGQFFREYRGAPRRPRAKGFQAFDLVSLNNSYPTITINEPGKGRLIGTVVVHHRDFRRSGGSSRSVIEARRG